MALSLLCGGLGVATASLEVVDQSGTDGTVTIYTKDEVDKALDTKGAATDVETNKAAIADLKNAVGAAGSGLTKEVADQKAAITANTKSIDTNKAAIESLRDDKLGKDLANSTFATKDALNDLTTTVNNKVDESVVEAALQGKADKATTLAGYGINDAYTKDKVDENLDLKANAADVYTKTDADGKFATSDALTTAKTDLEEKITTAKTELDGKIAGNTTKITANEKAIQNLNAKAGTTETTLTDLSGRMAAAESDIDGLQADMATAKSDIGTLKADVSTAKSDITSLKAKDTELSGKIDAEIKNRITSDTALDQKIDAEIKNRITSDTALDQKIDAEIKNRITSDTALDQKIDKEIQDRKDAIGTIAENKNYIEKDKSVSDNLVKLDAQATKNADAIAATNKRTAGIKRNDATNETTIEGNVTVDNLGNVKAKGDVTADGKLKGEGVDAGAGDITTTGAVNAGSLKVENASQLKGDVTMDKTLKVTGDTKLKKTDVDGTINVTGESSLKNTKVDGTLITTGKATFKEAVEMDKGLTVTNGATTLKGTTVDGALNVTGESSLKNTQVDGTFSVNKETTLNGTLTAKGEAKFEKNVTIEKDLTVNGKLNVGEIAMENKKTDADGTIHNSSTTITADGITHHGEVKKSGVTTESQFTHTEKGSETYAKKGDTTDWTETRSDVTADGVKTEAKDSKGNRTNTSQTAEGINGYVTDKDGNKTYTKVTATENSFQVQDKDGKNKNHQVNTKDSSVTEITNGDGKTTKTEQTATDITNTAKDGTITNDANHIVNKANTMDTTVTGKATESYGELETTVNGKETHTVTGNQDIHVTGKQTNTVGGGQENIISGGQTNTITGGQTNNITGDQTTTITGNKKETVTENVTEDYQKDLTTTVGGNENHEVKGTKTETVEGKVTENFKNGQETNVTGDQVIKVSGTQTTTATDINRNASSGMIDTIDNDYGTNTETKVAGKTTTDVSIKGTGEKGQYIRGANESRDYLIKGTLKNSETKTAEATSTEITDGTNKASTIQDAKNLAGSVTNGTETGVSGIHANNDGSVSIDSSVAGGGMSSVINQKKDSIQSAVGDGTNSTVIHQDKDNVTIASSNGMVGLVGKDIVNNAQNTITNTAGTSITNQVKDSKVTTDANGTTFENNTPAVSDGGTTTTKINGNHINTGRVDANELGVSDKDGANTADLSVKAGEGVKASAGNGTTTGSLDVKADEVVSSVKDADGKGSTFKQRIDAIMMESKNVSIKAEETLTNDAKDIVTNASHSITEKVGENNVTTKTTTSSKSEIQNADTITSVQQTEDMVQSYVGKKDGSATNVTTNFANASANKVTENGQSSTVLNNKDGLLIQNTANGNSFTTADGTNTGTAQGWTNVKGNEISTGKVEANYVKMDYADVMKDLGVRGNANITGKTTTGSLEVTGTSTLKGDVTMGSNAIVKKDLTVEGNTNLKNTKVDGTLDVTQKATFGDSVSIAKDLSAGGNATIKGDVTAKSYKVGDKTYISAAGINANDQKITNVADGSISEGSKDAVNGGQLYGVKRDLEHQVNKVGANAAAMANLRPMEFDPSSKWNIAAAIGNYGSETAAALGAFYRPNDDVMVNLSTAFGTGENMVGGGVSVRLGKGSNKLSREENNALKAQVDDLTARMDALLSVLNPNMSKDFPDVPENHWAYEAVSRLAGNDIVQGYPDGEFHGERTMTRYEMAEIIYNALSRGAEAEKELVEEFKPELQAMAASEKATAEKSEG